MEHVLLIVESILLEVRTHPIDLIKKGFGQDMKVIGDLFEKGKSRLWQIFNMYHITGTGINVYRSLTIDYKKDTELHGNFIMEPECTSVCTLVPHITEALTSSYCC
jgi:methanogenic corrinoid protein MtbC1